MINLTATAKPAYYALSKRGSTGPDVALIQTWLNGIRTRYPSIRSLTVDGKYGANTEAAVREFQRIAELAVDGKVGVNTWNALYANHSYIVNPGERYPGISIRSGNKGATVKSMQQQLTAKGYGTAADGIHGANTTTAVKAFQRANGLTQDGIVGSKTWAKLYA